MNQFVRVGLVGLTAVALSACSVFDTEKINYKSASKGVTLDVPPDLTQLQGDTRYVVAGGAVSANALQSSQAAQAAAPSSPSAANNTLGDARIERSGNQRWLVVKRPVDKLWDPVRDFWLENGFLLAIDQPKLGIMETDWAENRAKLPQDFIRGTIGKVFDGIYSTGERDKFRTRLERAANGDTEIYISHRGMVEVYTDKTARDQTVWQPRPVDPELETEFLRRLLVKLGATEAQSKEIVAEAAAPRQTTRVTTVGNMPVVQLDDGFDRAWRRVGLSLDRTGFTVEDRDRSQGLYYVRYVPPNADKKKQGFLGKLFSRSSDAKPPAKYRIAVKAEGSQTNVSVLSSEGAPENSADAQRILKIIADDLQ
ncbi:outer membrane protein assembly factor BamC [Xylophilus sp.]|uniref:outer membrane protein assembly factor BamC n=1 Tax=Xylophilus sp. TaxID=2653893 RepID=UPI0013BB02B7|nr:outer membrane protein assembly factor BamC [Xylophilus sp.]KAF1049117.1 MAG: hypothetical protein GAK38_00885 [Xylophilus sp.]